MAGVGLTATAVAVGTAILLFAISFAPAVADRDARTPWRDGQVRAPEGSGGTLVAVFEDHVAGRLLTRVQVALADGTPAPAPPAFTAMPRTGEAYVSPALGQLMADLPADELAERIGRVVGIIEDDRWPRRTNLSRSSGRIRRSCGAAFRVTSSYRSYDQSVRTFTSLEASLGHDEARICYKAEPWHFRYLGRATARTVIDSGLSLCEWLWSQQGRD